MLNETANDSFGINKDSCSVSYSDNGSDSGDSYRGDSDSGDSDSDGGVGMVVLVGRDCVVVEKWSGRTRVVVECGCLKLHVYSH